MNFLIFPNQLFDIKYLPKEKNISIYLLEDPLFFGKRETQFNFNKLKLILHCDSMRHYEQELKENGYKVHYLSYEQLKNLNYTLVPKSNVHCFEVNDYLLEKRLKQKIGKIHYTPSPNFFLSKKDLEDYDSKNKHEKNLSHKNFYTFVKTKLDILKNEKSYDLDNRNKIPKGTTIPSLPKVSINKKSIDYIEKLFPKNHGSTNLLYPTTRSESKKWFTFFLKKKLSKFGQYQDAIMIGENFLFHSVISPMFNIGLLDPFEIIEEITKYKSSIGMNNYEGFLRQIIGWREYQRFCYLYYYNDIKKQNIFGNQRKLNEKWYKGTLGIKPVDDTIKMAFEYGYLHHILRLMVMTNFMNLCGIHPDSVYQWFMEFSVDSYDWVMIQNVYSMGMWSDGGKTMRKPYISSDNYILKMSNYQCKNENWCPIWNSLYYNFMETHANILVKTPYGRNMTHWNKKNKKEKEIILKIAKQFLNKL